MAKPAPVGMDMTDPRLSVSEEKPVREALAYGPQYRKLYDPDVTFDEYHHYAKICRAEEDAMVDAEGRPWWTVIFPSKSTKGTQPIDDKVRRVSISANPEDRSAVTAEEWASASKALRHATAASVFYLITTDILGPFGLPYAFASTGYGPGCGLYTAFGIMAGVSGWLLHDCFMGLDSYEYPCRSYNDLAFRIYGNWARLPVLFLQALQLLCNVAIIIISNGQALSQVSKFKLCYAVCCLIWMICGYLLGQIRTLQKFGWLANAAVWINLLIMFITMGVSAHSPPLYSAYTASAGYTIDPDLVTPVNGTYPAVTHSGGLPDSANFASAVTGLMQAVYAYSGTQIFLEFMSEMRKPKDFLKGMWGAQFFIYFWYMLYGLFMYAYQGQYVVNPSYLGISPYGWSTTGNVLAMITALIAAALYGNIGLKVVYNSIGVQLFNAPPLTKKKGKYLWAVLIPVYWSIAFVVGAAIPGFSGFVGIVSAVCAMQFTYSFPPWLHLAYVIQKNAMTTGDSFDPATGQVVHVDSGIKRWARGFMAKRWYVNVFNILYLLGALATAGLGCWAAIKNLEVVYSIPQLTAFTCTSPLDAST